MTQTVYESMMRSIIVGEYLQGQVLTELFLANQFETSRTPVREACIRLHNEGFLRATARKGYVVTEVSLDEIRELYQLRQMLEPKAAALAAEAALGSQFFSTAKELLEKQSFIGGQDRSYEVFLELGKVEYGFHCLVAKASGNKKLAKIMSELMNQFRRFHYVTFQKSPWLNTTRDEHAEILRVIQLRDARLASNRMSEHIRKGSERAFQLALETVSSTGSGLRVGSSRS
jgi:DNA-binding GntR family transcriptional regulator